MTEASANILVGILISLLFGSFNWHYLVQVQKLNNNSNNLSFIQEEMAPGKGFEPL